MSAEDSDPLSGYGIWSTNASETKEVCKGAFADYDPLDPYGKFDAENPFELLHHLKDLGPGDHYRRVSRFPTLESAVVAGQVLSLLMPDEELEDDWGVRPSLLVRERLPSGSEWGNRYSCADVGGLAMAMITGLSGANKKLTELEREFARYRGRHMFCNVIDDDHPF